MKKKQLSKLLIISILTLFCYTSFTSCNKEVMDVGLEGNAGSQDPFEAILGDTNIVDGYFKRRAVFDVNDSLELFLNAKHNRKNVRIAIYDQTLKFVDSFYIDDVRQQSITTTEPFKNGFGYKYKINIKHRLKPGYYYLGKKIPFIIKNSRKSGDIAIVYALNTENAYNTAGGGSLYSSPKATSVSYLRPVPVVDQFMKGFLASNPIKGDWIVDYDLEDYTNFQNYKVLVIPGHNEYMTRVARKNIDRFVNEGGHLLILSGNTAWWQVRYSKDKTQMICYKDAPDPEVNVLYKTVNWNNPILKFPMVPSIGAEFTYAGYGVKNDSGWDGYKILKPESPLFEGINPYKGQILSCPGKEWDGAPTVIVNGEPVIDTTKWKPYKAEILAYDRTTRHNTNNTNTIGTFIVFKRSANSGTIVNVCNTNWCAANGLTGINGAQLRQITINAVNGLVANKNMFTY